MIGIIAIISIWLIILMALIGWLYDSENEFIPMCVIVVYLVASVVFVASGDNNSTYSSGHSTRVPYTAYYSTYHSILH